MFNFYSPFLLSTLMTSQILLACPPQGAYEPPPTPGAVSFIDPGTGKPGGWIAKNELSGEHTHPHGTFYVEPYVDFELPFSALHGKSRKLKYLILASNNVLLNGRPEEESVKAEGWDGIHLKASARLTEARGGVVVCYFWAYDGNNLVGYSKITCRIHPTSMKDKLGVVQESMRALQHMQKWEDGIRNW